MLVFKSLLRKLTFFFFLIVVFIVIGCGADKTESGKTNEATAQQKNDGAREGKNKENKNLAQQKLKRQEDQKRIEISSKKYTFPPEIEKQFVQFREWVLAGNKDSLATLFEYPLKRPNALIHSKEEFIEYYDSMFEAKLVERIKDVKLGERDFIIKSDNYGVLGGKIWFRRHTGKVWSFRYQSDQEKKEEALKKSSIENRDHISIAGWKDAKVRCETEKFIIYILSYPEKGLSYVSWSKPKTTSEKPDLQLHNGETEYKGTMGGVIYSFANGQWKYVIEENRLGPGSSDGFYLKLFKGEEQVLEQKARKIFE